VWELRALLLPWSRGEGEGRRAGAAHLGAGSLCQQFVHVMRLFIYKERRDQGCPLGSMQ